jgi:hypothetical protein
MKKLVLLGAVLAAFSISSAFAGSCPSECGGGKKGKEGSKEGEKQTLTVQVAL